MEYGCYVRVNSAACCGLCGRDMVDGDKYCRMKLNTYTNTYFHGDCLLKAGKKANSCSDDLEKKKKEIEEKKIKRKKAVAEMNWRKKVCREAIKEAGRKPTDYEFSGATKTARIRITKRSGKDFFSRCFVWFEPNSEVIVGPASWVKSANNKKLTLAGPDALKIVGKSIVRSIHGEVIN